MKKLPPVLVLFLFIPFFTFTSLVGDRTIPVEMTRFPDGLKRMYAPDECVALFGVDYSFADKNVMLRGVTTLVEAKVALLQGLAKASYKIVDCIRMFPDAKGLEGKACGIINVSVANLHTTPDFSSEMITQGLMGMPIHVLQRDGWVHIQAPDNYITWVHHMGVHLVNEAEIAAQNNTEKIVVTIHYGFIYSKPDRTSQTISDVVAGNRFKWNGSKGAFCRVIYPDDHQGCISKSIAMPGRGWRSGLKQDATDIIRTARAMIGISYLWAGTSSKGVDCSGFVRTIFFMRDIAIPRDASQQTYIGKHIDIASDFSNLQPGDLIFFDRKTTAKRKERMAHVGMYIDGKHFIHSQRGVHINSFDPLDELLDEYNLGRLLFVARVLPYINKKTELNTTATNEYYERADKKSIACKTEKSF